MKRVWLWAAVAALAVPAFAAPALRIAPGSIARSEVVAIGRDVLVEGEARPSWPC
jgi:hypothetical protein